MPREGFCGVCQENSSLVLAGSTLPNDVVQMAIATEPKRIEIAGQRKFGVSLLFLPKGHQRLGRRELHIGNARILFTDLAEQPQRLVMTPCFLLFKATKEGGVAI